MQVFKTYFKILKENFFGIGLYIAIFMIISVVTALQMNPPASKNLEQTKVKVAIINHDEKSQIVAGFTRFLEEYAVLITLEDDKDAIQEAIFSGRIDYSITIPKNFTQSMQSMQTLTVPQLEVVAIAKSAKTYQMNMLIDKYLNLVAMFLSENPTISPQLLQTQLQNALEQSAQLNILPDSSPHNRNYLVYFYLLPFVLLATTIIGITTVMFTFNRTAIYRRNSIAPLKLKSMNIQIIFGNFFLALFIWALMIALGILINLGHFTADAQFYTVLFNSFILMIVCISISSLAGLFIKTNDARTAISNIVSLGSCYIGGVFVDQQALGATVNKIAAFTPVHWYIKANDFVRLSGGSLGGLHSDKIAQAITIQLLFATTFFTVAIAYSKAKRKGSQE